MNYLMKKLSAPKWKEKLYPIDKIDKKKLSFYKYIKNKNIVIDFYHGTSNINIELMEKVGWISPPSWRGKSKDEQRYKSNIHEEEAGLNKIFFTKSLENAEYYANRDAIFWNSDKSISLREEYGISLDEKAVPEILKISIPLFELDEIKGNVFNTFIYNESRADEIIGLIIESDDSNEEKLNQILEFIDESKFSPNNEFTVKGGLPLKRLGGFKYVSRSFNKDYLINMIYKDPIKAVNLISDHIIDDMDIKSAFEESFIYAMRTGNFDVTNFFHNIPSFLINNYNIKKEIQQLLIKKPYIYYFLTDYYKEDPDVISKNVYNSMKNFYLRIKKKDIYTITGLYKEVPDILKDDPDIIKWYKELSSGSLNNWYKLSSLKSDELNEKINSLVEKFKSEIDGLNLSVWLSNSGYIEIAHIEVPLELRNQKIGSFIIKSFQELAKEYGYPIVLRPEPDRGKKKALDNFYKNLGFVYNKGRNKNYELSTPFAKSMYWIP